MKSLFFSYNVASPFAVLAGDGQVLRFLREADYYDSVDPHATFPENAMEQLLGSCEHVDQVVFLGKPFLYLENVVNLHAYLFPRACRRFAGDLFHFFSEVADLRSVVRDLIEDAKLTVTVDLDRMYYVRMDEALAHAVDAPSGSTIITCLSDVFEGTSCCCFEKRGRDAVLTGEVDGVGSLANLLRLHAKYGDGVDLADLVSFDSSGGWHFVKPRVHISYNAFDLVPGLSLKNGDLPKRNVQTLAKVFSGMVTPIERPGQPVVFMSDVEIPPQIVAEHPDFRFVVVDDESKGAAAAAFFHHKYSSEHCGDGKAAVQAVHRGE